MHTKGNSNLTLIALVFSAIALVLSGISFVKNSSLDDDVFMAKLESGIEDYVEKQKNQNKKTIERFKISVDDDAVLGSRNAPVTIVEFSDYECPFCARFYKTTLPKLKEKYIDTGKAKLVFRDFPLAFHKKAKQAAIAAECVKVQSGNKAYFQYHNQLYSNQKDFSTNNFKKWAAELGLKSSEFNKCLDEEKYANEVEADFKEGKTYGVTGTPTFFINGRRLSGAKTFEDFKEVIEEELKISK